MGAMVCCASSAGATGFTRNQSDHGNDTGYQVEFNCDTCRNGYRSSFQGSALGVGSKIAKGLDREGPGTLFGGNRLGLSASPRSPEGRLRDAGWDEACKKEIDEIEPRFHQCTRCGQWGLSAGLLE